MGAVRQCLKIWNDFGVRGKKINKKLGISSDALYGSVGMYLGFGGLGVCYCTRAVGTVCSYTCRASAVRVRSGYAACSEMCVRVCLGA